jgi:hypothetical protein
MAVLGAAAGGGNTPFPTIVFQTSRTWTCPMAMEAMVFVIGAGGGGAGGFASSGNRIIVNGGGAGGCSVSKLTLAAQDYTLVVGSYGGGGNRIQGSDGNGVGNGTAGGNSTFAGSGITTMAGNGGAGGNGASSNNYTASGSVAGGTATGGTIANNAGGGNSSRSNGSYGYAHATSGGGVGLWEVGENGALANNNNVVVQGGGPFRNRALGATSIPSAEGRSGGILTGDIFKGIQQMVRDQSSNGYASHPTRYTNSVNYTGRPVQLMPPLNASQYRYLSGSSPFTGGAGQAVSGNNYSGVGSAGVAGGGGGSSSSYNSGYGNYGGSGGNGVIIIMPLTVGS